MYELVKGDNILEPLIGLTAYDLDPYLSLETDTAFRYELSISGSSNLVLNI
jgi:hypothetical protein